MNVKELTFKNLHYYSKYYFGILNDCEFLRKENKGHFALFSIFSLLENIIKSTLNNFEITFQKSVEKLYELNVISESENNLLNDKYNGFRKLRNIFAHANLSKYDLEYANEKVTFPLSENENCLKLYDEISEIIFFIILKLINIEMKVHLDINQNFSEEIINNFNYKIILRTPEELMKFKGLNLSNEFIKLPESAKYRLVENSSDTFIMQQILKNLLE